MRDELEHLFDPDFIEQKGVVLLATEKQNFDPYLTWFDDLSELELFLNHIHILDFFQNDAESEEHPFYDESSGDFKFAWETVQTLVPVWAEKLTIKFPDYQFKIIGTKYDNPIIRFCRLRSPEPPEYQKHDDKVVIIT